MAIGVIVGVVVVEVLDLVVRRGENWGKRGTVQKPRHTWQATLSS